MSEHFLFDGSASMAHTPTKSGWRFKLRRRAEGDALKSTIFSVDATPATIRNAWPNGQAFLLEQLESLDFSVI
ncbi:MAG: hypothetical protein WBZ48_14650 [Bacteroidota bacterium]